MRDNKILPETNRMVRLRQQNSSFLLLEASRIKRKLTEILI